MRGSGGNYLHNLHTSVYIRKENSSQEELKLCTELWWPDALSGLDVCARISRPEWPKRLYILIVKTYLWLLWQNQVYNVTCLYTYMLWTKLLLLTAVSVSVIFFGQWGRYIEQNSVSKSRHILKLNFDFIIKMVWCYMYLNVYADCKKKSWNLFFQNLKA